MQSREHVHIPILVYNMHVISNQPIAALGENYTWVLGHVQGPD